MYPYLYEVKHEVKLLVNEIDLLTDDFHKKKKKNSSFLASVNEVFIHPSLKQICPGIETESGGTTASQ